MNKYIFSKKSKNVFSLFFLLFIVLFFGFFLLKNSQNNNLETKFVRQLEILPGQSIKWMKIVDLSKDDNTVSIPKIATNIKVSTKVNYNIEKEKIFLDENDYRIRLSKLSEENSKSKESFVLAESIKKQNIKGIRGIYYRIISKIDSLFATVSETDLTEMTEVDLSLLLNSSSDYQNDDELVSTTKVDNKDGTSISSLENISTDNLEESFSSEEEFSTTTDIQISTTTATTTLLTLEYETPSPVIAEAMTEEGKIVSVSAPEGEVPITNVLAFTNIPEIYKVGQEDKIKIKWQNNENQEVEFHAYDLNNNGKLDYVEWTVPHLSTQIFEIIFISKAFLLDADKNIIEDIYDTVKVQDNNWVSVTNGQYIRVTFEQTLTSDNDITLYARPTNVDDTATIQVYNTNTNQLVTTFNIDREGLYKQLIPNLQTPTDIFDLKIVGNIDIDYVVDPADISTGLVAHWKMNDINGTTIADNIGMNNGTGTYTAAVGKVDSSINFNGTSDYINLGDSVDLQFSNTDNFSLAFWINWNGSSNSYASIISKENMYSGYTVLIKGNNRLAVYLSGGVSALSMDGLGGQIPTGWHYIVVNCNSAEGITTYIDGVLDYTQSGVYNFGATSENAYIGKSFFADRFLAGGLDDVRIYNRVLSQSDIDLLYNSGNGTEEDGSSPVDVTSPIVTINSPINGFVGDDSVDFNISATDESSEVSIIPSLDSSLVSWYRMDDVDGTTLTDYVGNNNGTIVGGATQVAGKFGSAMNFDGVDDSITTEGFTNSFTNELTFSFWVNGLQTGYLDGFEIMVESDSSGWPNNLIYGLVYTKNSDRYSNSIEFVYGGSSWHIGGADQDMGFLADGNWHHIVAVHNSVSDTIYVDGTSYSSYYRVGSFSSILNPIANPYIRIDSLGVSSQIDDTLIFNRALTSDEIISLYNGTAINHTSTLVEGSHTYKAYAQDLSGNVGQTSTSSFIVDITNPIITINSPIDGLISSSSVDFSVSSTDINLCSIIPSLDSSLVSWYRMDDVDGTTLTDYVGNNNGTIVGGATQVAGKFGSAMNFDGSSTYINIGNPDSLQLQYFTVLAWVKSTDSDSQFLLSHSPEGSSGWGLIFNDTKIYFDDAWVSTVLEYNTNVHDGAWHQLGIYRDINNNVGLILDGQIVETGNYTGTFGFSDLLIGSRAGTNILNGSLDDVMIFSRALTSDEIVAVYDGTSINHTSVLTDGSYIYSVYAQDSAGNIASTTSNFTIDTDTTAPTTYDDYVGKNNVWQNSNQTIALTPTDDGTGIAWTKYCIDINNTCDISSGILYTIPVVMNNEGVNYFRYASADNSNNIQETVSRVVKIDKTNPIIDIGSDVFATSTIIRSSTSTDDISGIASYLWSGDVNFGNSTSSSTTINANTDDSYIIRLTVTDNAGNSSYDEFTLTLDTIPPTISNINPSSGSRIRRGDIVSFTLNESGDCRMSTINESYDEMSNDVSCTTNNSIQISCVIPDLGGAGTKNLYFACEDSFGNKDTSSTTSNISYVIKSSNTVYSNITTDSENIFEMSIDNLIGITDNKIVKLKFKYSTDINSFVLANNPDFSNAITVLAQTDYEYDICDGKDSCEDGDYTIYAKALTTTGSIYSVITDSIKLNTVSLVEEVVDEIVDITDFILTKEDENILPPQNITEEPPESLTGKWNIVPPIDMADLSYMNLPLDFVNIIKKFPDLSSGLKNVDITKIDNDLSIGTILLPGLGQNMGLSNLNNISLSNFSDNQYSKIPTNIIFARTVDESIDLNIKLAVSNEGLTTQTLNTTQGQPIKFVLKPDYKAKKVSGYLLFKSTNNDKTASVIDSVSEQEFVINKFDYVDNGNGVWTADVISPHALGEYELKTVVSYEEPDREQGELRIIVLVDPEGYIYRKIGKDEVRISNATVSIYWLDKETQKYEIWQADKFKQKNPQITDVTGRYTFLVPTGKYYITVKADGYKEYQSEEFEVEESKGVFMNIELIKEFKLTDLLDVRNILLVLISLILIYFVALFTIRRSKNN